MLFLSISIHMWPPCIQNAMEGVQGEGARLQDRDVDFRF